MVNSEGLSDLEEPDELAPVQSLGSGLVAVDLREPRVDGWVRTDEAVDVREPEEASDRVHHGDDRRVHQSRVAELADVELDVSALNAVQRVKAVVVAPGESAS